MKVWAENNPRKNFLGLKQEKEGVGLLFFVFSPFF
jgi:hypothetical protein